MPKRSQTEHPALRGRTVFRSRDFDGDGASRHDLRTLLRRGDLERVSRGLYRSRLTQASGDETFALVSTRAPKSVICLLSALRFHEIGTQSPREVWIAVDRKARRPVMRDLPVRVVRFSGRMLTYGVQVVDIEGVPVRITSPSRTVVDCFRYRRKIGLDVALEALQDALKSRKATVDQLLRTAEMCRALTVVRPYVEAVFG